MLCFNSSVHERQILKSFVASFNRPSPTWARGFGSGSVRLAEAAVRHVEAQRLVAVVEAAEAAAGRRRRARGAPAVLAATEETIES